LFSSLQLCKYSGWTGNFPLIKYFEPSLQLLDFPLKENVIYNSQILEMIGQETHPWKCFVPKNSEILIIGTFPTAKKNWSFNFFYPNKSNLFWQVISRVVKKDLEHFTGDEAIAERKNMLELLNVAITDMGFKIVRKGGSSLDENLIVIKYMDIFQILNETPKINKIIFTSSSGSASASKWFIEYLKGKNIIHKFPKGRKPLRSEIQFLNRTIKLVILYSPSRRAANRISFDSLFEMYENEIKSL
jgi:G:T/U-mismatch repair DNA glycosylase